MRLSGSTWYGTGGDLSFQTYVNESVVCTVTFDSGEGTAVPSQKVLYLHTATAPTSPTREGYRFDGWYTDISYATAWDFATDTVNDNITLYAKWTETCAVTFVLGGYGSRTGGGELVQTVGYGEAAVAPTFNVASGWAFTGWDTDFSNVTTDLTVIAQYSQIHTVTFDLGAYGTRIGGGELVQTVIDGQAGVAPTFDVAVGWAFTGWDTDFSNVTSDLTVTAQYTEVYDTTVTLSGTKSAKPGQKVTITATVDVVGSRDNPTGTVTFWYVTDQGGEKTQIDGTVTLVRGKATLTTTSLPVGGGVKYYIITAEYDSNTVKYNSCDTSNPLTVVIK